MIQPENLFSIFEEYGPPINKGVMLDFLPDDKLLENLSKRFDIEFAVMFTLNKNAYFLYAGNRSSINLPILIEDNNIEILLKHTHPLGTPHPSNADINWLKDAIEIGSPQVQSVILPIGIKRVTFNIYTPSFETINAANEIA